MRPFTPLAAILFSLILFSSCNTKTSERIKFNEHWKFKLLAPSENSENELLRSDFDDSAWKDVSLPHTANIEPLTVNDQWQGTCWYRKTFSVPASFSDKKVILELEAAMNHSKIWVNENLMTVHQGGYLPVVMDISKYIVAGKENLIAIRLNNTDNAITGPKPLQILDFNMYGGLYRNAWLIVKNKVHISHPVLAGKVAGGGIFITYPKVSEKESVVHIKTHLVNETDETASLKVVQSIYYKDELILEKTSTEKSIAANSDLEFVEQLKMDQAKLWSPSTPELYTLKTSVLVDDQPMDKETTRFGIRKFEFKDNQLFVNGEKTFMRGVNRHQEYPFVGYALSDNAQYRDAKKIKDAGFNFIRLSHYPQSPAFMDACDELGLIVFDAILGWQYYNDNDQFREYCYRSARELILRDRNRPSVLAWEVSLNETRMPVFFMKELHRIVHAEYPGDNVYSCGWMDDVYDIYLQARQHRIMHPHDLMNKPYFVSEYGDWEYYSNNAGLNQHQLSKDKRYETSSRQKREYGEERLLQQAYNVHEAHNDNLGTPAFGDGYWVMYDYNRGYHDDIEFSGIMDIFRIPKFAYSFYKSQKNPVEGVVLDIGTFWTKKSPLNVKVFSNCDQVELFLNGSLLGKQSPDKDDISDKLSHPPFTFKMEEFQSGELKAIGYIDGKEAETSIVKTPGIASGLKVWLDESGKAPESGCNDVLFLYIAGIDQEGTINPDFIGKIDLDFKGDIEIMNPDAIKAEAGIATALIRIGDSKGNISMTASSETLNSDEFTFNVK